MAQSTSSGFHTHSSHGRTRTPKGLVNNSPTGASVTLRTASQVTLVAAAASLNDALNDATLPENGYITENQRFLHILVGNGTANDVTADARTATAYGYNYAFGKWFPLLDVGGNAVAVTAPDNDGAEAVAGRKAQTFEIAGVDRVAFIGVAAHTICFAACTTF
jgi:hypothetical protein